jgi:hypothetical protein
VRRVIGRTLSIIGVAIMSIAGCTELQPETGERLVACSDTDSDRSKPVSFKDQIRPMMSGQVPGVKGCGSCHYPTGATREGLDAVQMNLATLGDLKRGGTNTAGRTVIPGKPCDSALVQKLRGTFGGARMPRGGPYWEPAQIQLVMDWIAEGAQGEDGD